VPTGHCLTQQIRLSVPRPRLTWDVSELVDRSVTVLLQREGVETTGQLETQTIHLGYPGSEGEAMMVVGGTVGKDDARNVGVAETLKIRLGAGVALPRKVSTIRHPDSDGILGSGMDDETTTLVSRVTGPRVAALIVRSEGVVG
jgi:hypothetical protein